jgi:hypothetical protein
VNSPKISATRQEEMAEGGGNPFASPESLLVGDESPPNEIVTSTIKLRRKVEKRKFTLSLNRIHSIIRRRGEFEDLRQAFGEFNALYENCRDINQKLVVAFRGRVEEAKFREWDVKLESAHRLVVQEVKWHVQQERASRTSPVVGQLNPHLSSSRRFQNLENLTLTAGQVPAIQLQSLSGVMALGPAGHAPGAQRRTNIWSVVSTHLIALDAQRT